MAIKISGNTVIDDSQNITATGSATFAGAVQVGDYDPSASPAATDYGVFNNTDGALFLNTNYPDQSAVFQISQSGVSKSRITSDGKGYFTGSVNVGGTTLAPNIELLSNGSATFAGNLDLGDNNRIRFGADSDLQIYHNGSDSYIHDAGTGDLILLANNLRVANTSGTNYITGISGGAVTLLHGGNAKLATTSTGVNVTGTVESSGALKAANGAFEVDSSGVIQTNINTAGIVKLSSTADFANPKIELNSANGVVEANYYNANGIAGFVSNATSDAGYAFRGANAAGTLTTQIFTSGDASFAGNVNIGGYNGISDTTDGCLFGSTGGIYTQLSAATAATGVLFQGMHGNTYTSRITANGSAKFTGDISGGSNQNATVNGSGSTLGLEGYLKLFHSTTQTHPWLQFFKSDGSGGYTKKIEYLDSGDATFAGVITAAGYSLSNLTELT